MGEGDSGEDKPHKLTRRCIGSRKARPSRVILCHPVKVFGVLAYDTQLEDLALGGEVAGVLGSSLLWLLSGVVLCQLRSSYVKLVCSCFILFHVVLSCFLRCHSSHLLCHPVLFSVNSGSDLMSSSVVQC